jgi:hypothetical protein
MLDSVTLTHLPKDAIFMLHESDRQWYFEKNYGQDTLVISAGDSWTWGDSLGGTTREYDNFEYRTNHIYGHLLAKILTADFINIGLPGLDNISIINYLDKVLSNLTKPYKQIYIVITLTEIGRELTNTFLNFESLYTDVLAGSSWPIFNDIVLGTYKEDQLLFAIKELSDTNSEFIHTLQLYLKIKSATSVVELLELTEQYVLTTINSLFDKYNALNLKSCVGRNFTSYFDNNKKLLKSDIIVANQRWVDVIADQGKLTAYPDPLYLMSGIAIEPVIKFTKHLNIRNSKLQLLDLIEQSLLGVNWLTNSPFNSPHATKHPLEHGHQWWGAYIYKQLTK